MTWIALVIDYIFRILLFVVLIDVLLSYFMQPYHPVRRALDRVVQPLLAPIRRFLPAGGQVDFSPVVLMIGLLIMNQIIQALLR
jgi:YggT family protein